MGFAPNFDSFPTLYGLLVPRRGRRHELQERGKGSAMPSVWQIGELTGSAAIASKSSVLIPPQRKAIYLPCTPLSREHAYTVSGSRGNLLGTQ